MSPLWLRPNPGINSLGESSYFPCITPGSQPGAMRKLWTWPVPQRCATNPVSPALIAAPPHFVLGADTRCTTFWRVHKRDNMLQQRERSVAVCPREDGKAAGSSKSFAVSVPSQPSNKQLLPSRTLPRCGKQQEACPTGVVFILYCGRRVGTGSCHLAQADHGHAILLPSHSECWDYKCLPPHWALVCNDDLKLFSKSF